MHKKRTRIIVGLLTVCFVALMSAYAQVRRQRLRG